MNAPVPASRGEQVRSAAEVRSTALIVASALLMQTLDASIVVIALPRLARDLGIATGEMSMIISVYLVALMAFLPISAWASSRFGAKRMFVLAMGLFALFSAVSALSTSFTMLLAARFCQGASGSMMSPIGRTLLMRGLKSDQLLGATFWMTVPAVIGPVFGPPLGGIITDLLGWRYVFWLNAPIGLIGMVLVIWKVRPVHEDRPRAADVIGIILSALTLTVLVIGLETLVRSRWSPLLLGTGAVLAVLMVRHLRRVPAPAFALSLLRYPGPRSAATAGLVMRISAGGMTFMLPLVLQLHLHFSASLAGFLAFFAAIGSLALRTVMNQLTRLVSMRRLLVASSVAFAAMLIVAGLMAADWPIPVIAVVVALMGTCRGLSFITMGALAFLDVPSEEMGSAAVLYAVTQQLPQVLGVALASLMLTLLAGFVPLAALGISAYAATFALLALISLVSGWMFSRFPAEFGSGLRQRRGS